MGVGVGMPNTVGYNAPLSNAYPLHVAPPPSIPCICEIFVMQMLLNGHGVNGVDYDDRSALMVAACKGHVEIIEMLLEAGADPNMKVGMGVRG